ncbi:MAG TPA: hypothetical protein VN258_11850 [Mobilitalea sp.]|nr:hypothetical protein [Mobilitalea sp.]
MKKRLLISIVVLLFSYILMSTKPALAATHTHTDDCYNGAVHVHTGNSTSGEGCYGGVNCHVHTGNSSSGGGCYGGINYHSHTGSSSSGGGCYGSPVYHSHTGNSTSGGGCYGSAIYHSHTGNSTSGGGCYGKANYHVHTGNSTSGGGCYGKVNYHVHTGNSTSGGGCYGQANYHVHTGNSTSGGGCYGKANYHNHVSGCYGTCNAIIGSNGICPSCGGANMPGFHCPRTVLKCGKTTSTIVSYSINCGKTTSTIVSYSINCGKTTSTIVSYSMNCGKTTSTIVSYSMNCGKTTTTIESYALNCGKTTSSITGYALNCGKTTSTIDRYSLSCGKSTSYIESYYMNCGKTTSTIVSYYINCGKTAGYYYNGSTRVSPICNTVVDSIIPTNPAQTITQGGTIDTTATATYLDGSTGTISCSAVGFDTYTIGDQIVILTYVGLVGNAKTTGIRSCTMSVNVKVDAVTVTVGASNLPNSISNYQNSRWYKFTTSQPGYYIISSTGNADTSVQLYDSSVTLLGTNLNGASDGRNFRLGYSLAENQTYYFEINISSSSVNIPYYYRVDENLDTWIGLTEGGSWVPDAQTYDPDGWTTGVIKCVYLTPQQAAAYSCMIDQTFIYRLQDGAYAAADAVAITYALSGAKAKSLIVKAIVDKYGESAIVAGIFAFIQGAKIVNLEIPSATELLQQDIDNKTSNFTNGLLIKNEVIMGNTYTFYETWNCGTTYVAYGEPRYKGHFTPGDIQVAFY